MKKLLYIMLIGLAISSLNAQPRDRIVVERMKKIFSELLIVPTESKDSVKIINFIKIPYKALTFKTNTNPATMDEKYFSEIYIEINFKNQENIIKGRTVLHKKLFSQDNSDESMINLQLNSYLEVTLPIGNYRPQIEVTDENKNPIFTERLNPIALQSIYTKANVYDPIFTFKNTNRYIPFSLDSSISFNSSDANILLLVTGKNSNSTFNYKIKKMPDLEPRFSFGNENIEFGSKLNTLLNKVLDIDKDIDIDKSMLNSALSLKNFNSSEVNFSIIEIPIDNKNLVPGRYQLLVTHSELNDTFKFNFSIVWENQPTVLNSPDFATEIMYYILSDLEYEKLKELDTEDKYNAIYEYWKKKDPTPNTNYNESMAEYFRRVDVSNVLFKNATEAIGAKSERGKIYILYGKPDKIETQPQSENTLELWKYSKVKKEFVFEATPSGIYKLIKVNE